MRLGKEIKRDTQLIIISVLVLTLVTMSVSYSAFFSVESQSTVQTIETGTLEVVIDSTPAQVDDLFPVPESDLPTASNSVAKGNYALLNLNNTGTLDAEFSVSISYDTASIPSGKSTDDLISFSYLNIGIYDADNNVWLDLGNGAYFSPITAWTASAQNVYPVFKGTIEDGREREIRVYIWLDEDTPTTEIGKLVYLKLDVKSATLSE